MLVEARSKNCSFWSLCTDEVIAKLFGYHSDPSHRAAINSTALRKCFNEFRKKLHPDKTHILPQKIQYVTKMLLMAMSYVMDRFHERVSEHARIINASESRLQDFPLYGTVEFRQVAELSQMEDLSQPDENEE